MEDAATSSTQSVWKNRRWLMWTFIVIISLDSLVRVFLQWPTYDYVKRFDAVVFALLLLAFPVSLKIDFRRGKHIETERIVVYAYIILMTVTILCH